MNGISLSNSEAIARLNLLIENGHAKTNEALRMGMEALESDTIEINKWYSAEDYAIVARKNDKGSITKFMVIRNGE